MQVCNIQTLFYLSCRVFCEYNIGVPAQGGVVAPPPHLILTKNILHIRWLKKVQKELKCHNLYGNLFLFHNFVKGEGRASLCQAISMQVGHIFSTCMPMLITINSKNYLLSECYNPAILTAVNV